MIALRAKYLLPLLLTVCPNSLDVRAEEAVVAGLPEGVVDDHPLIPAFQLVASQLVRIREEVGDYSCRLVKRERIDGQLQQYRFIDAKVRRASREGGPLRSFAIRLEYRGPRTIAGRSVLFIEGENGGRMLVRQTGLLNNVTLSISPDSAAARRESLQPITDLGFEKMALTLLEKISEEMQLDPAGDNTDVDETSDAKIDGRPCKYFRVTHFKPQSGLTFHKAEVFLDDEWQLPVRVVSYDWPPAVGEEPPLISEYNYTRLQLNIVLEESLFDPGEFGRLRSRP